MKAYINWSSVFERPLAIALNPSVYIVVFSAVCHGIIGGAVILFPISAALKFLFSTILLVGLFGSCLRWCDSPRHVILKTNGRVLAYRSDTMTSQWTTLESVWVHPLLVIVRLRRDDRSVRYLLVARDATCRDSFRQLRAWLQRDFVR
ncbi:MAG: hypothetical protein OES26_24355 [Gammaproteobacteria bacterium]|nr:hypothetical protein [Gammaproteobacteria bacterium]